ncbi:unnamed protein product [Mycena citricolor]|uniref:Carboxylesterase type B domain-containing protein n=1 Tax=Mycena citricolor TaxID=2018698 RepID=A0AAD2HI72_9AGAR|nr:unnamed protein product [Mycena citricolor]CAK5277044.1 unnamed protein product [Mycena citricolor]
MIPSILSTLLVLALGASGAPSVKLGKTTVIGTTLPTFGQELFAGIPYAKPPIGELRFKPTVLTTSLNGSSFNATQFGPACLQPLAGGTAHSLPVGSPISEDCLTINIIRPIGVNSTSKLPVMFWTYGGGFFVGASEVYNASALVAQSVERGTPVILVNFNYRLGPLGFPQGTEALNEGSLNLALRDQLAALEWVQKNIGKFGGDKRKVLAFGQSAGSMITSLQFLNPRMDKLVRAAIFESGAQSSGGGMFEPARRDNVWSLFVGAVPSCASLAGTNSTFSCLRNANTTEMLNAFLYTLSHASENFPWDPAIDGPGGLIPELPSNLLLKGKFAKIPFIAGSNLDEGTLFTSTTMNSSAEINATITAGRSPAASPAELQATIARMLELYPDDPSLQSPFGTGNETFGLSSQYKRYASIDGDVDFHSQRRFWINAAANASVPTYGYLFTQPQPQLTPRLGVDHGAEVNYVLGGLNDTTPSAVQLSRVMMDYWISFATSLTPNDGIGSQRPEWTQFTPAAKNLIQLNGSNLTMIPDTYREEQIGFINSNPAIWHH